MTDQTKNRMPLSELERTEEYQKLTPKQRLFVATYVAGGIATSIYDPVDATRIAYKCKNLEVARIMHYSLLANIRIVEVLNRHFNTAPIEQYLRLLDHAIRNKKLTPSQLEAIRLKGAVLGFVTRVPSAHGKNSSNLTPFLPEEPTQKPEKSKRKGAKPGPKPKAETSTPYDFH